VADDCGAFDPVCKAKEWAGSAIGDAISNLADGVMEAFGHAIGALGTIWVRIGTPNLTGGATVVPAGEPPGTASIDTVLGYATWIGFGIAVIGLIVAGVRLALSRSGQTQAAVERIGVVLIAVILISASVGIVTALLAPGRTASPTVSFLQNSLWYYTLAVAVLGVIVAGARMAWEQRADPGKHLVQGLLTLVVVAGAGLSVVGLLTAAADAFSVWILNNSLDCTIAGDGTCFGESMLTLLSLTSGTTGGLGAVLAIILGVFAVFAALAQVVLMIVRAGALVVLAGMLPIAAAASLSDPQRTMFRKTSAWLLGFILYKPAAAIVYAAAFRLAGSNLFGDDGLVTVLTGLALMVLALVALPALMRLIVPAVTAVSGGGSLAGLGLAGAAAALPTGAAAANRLSSGGGSNGTSGGGSGGAGGGSAGPTGSAGTAGSTGGGSGAAGSSGAAGAAASGGASAAAGAAVPPVAAASAAMTAASAAGRAARTAAETTTAGGPDGAV
jgi:hypothetical protein